MHQSQMFTAAVKWECFISKTDYPCNAIKSQSNYIALHVKRLILFCNSFFICGHYSTVPQPIEHKMGISVKWGALKM